MSQTQRMFVALFPPPETVTIIHGLALECCRQTGGRVIAAPDLHITLKFLGNIDARTQACVEMGLEQQWPGLPDFEMDRLEYRARQRMLWLTTDQAPNSLKQIAEQVEALTVACGTAPSGYSFLPHITLIRNARKSPTLQAEILPIRMTYDRIALVRSETLPEGSRYSIVRSFSLDK